MRKKAGFSLFFAHNFLTSRVIVRGRTVLKSIFLGQANGGIFLYCYLKNHLTFAIEIFSCGSAQFSLHQNYSFECRFLLECRIPPGRTESNSWDHYLYCDVRKVWIGWKTTVLFKVKKGPMTFIDLYVVLWTEFPTVTVGLHVFGLHTRPFIFRVQDQIFCVDITGKSLKNWPYLIIMIINENVLKFLRGNSILK